MAHTLHTAKIQIARKLTNPQRTAWFDVPHTTRALYSRLVVNHSYSPYEAATLFISTHCTHIAPP